MREDVALWTERKFARWTAGRWAPSRSSLAFRTFALDWIGTILMLGIITCLVLALQWGGVKYAWSAGPVVACFVVFAVLIPTFVGFEWKLAGPSRIMPLEYFNGRTQVRSSAHSRSSRGTAADALGPRAGRSYPRRLLHHVRPPRRDVLPADLFRSSSSLCPL